MTDYDLHWNSTMTCNRLVRMLNGDILPGKCWAGRRTDDFGFAARLWLWIISSCKCKLHHDGAAGTLSATAHDRIEDDLVCMESRTFDLHILPIFTNEHLVPCQWSFDRVWLSVHDINWKPGAFDLCSYSQIELYKTRQMLYRVRYWEHHNYTRHRHLTNSSCGT